VFKPFLTRGHGDRGLSVTLEVAAIPVFKPDPGRDSRVPFCHGKARAIRFTSPTHPPRGADRHLTTTPPPGTPQLTVDRHSVRQIAPVRAPIGAPMPRNRCVQATSRAGGAKVCAPLRPPKCPQSLCSSQIRPRGANSPFGRNHQTFCVSQASRAPLRGHGVARHALGKRGWPAAVALGGLRLNHGCFRALCARNPCVQAVLAVRARLPCPIRAPEEVAIPVFKPDRARGGQVPFGHGRHG
jgi:hypothetical protein